MSNDPARWGTQITVSPINSAAGTVRPSVAGIGPISGETGRFAIVWQQSQDLAGLGDTIAIAGQMFNGDGTKLGSTFLVNSTTHANQLAPVVIDRDGGDGFAVAFNDQSRTLTGFGSDVRLRLFDGDGNAQGNDFVINSGGPTEIYNQAQVSLARGTSFAALFASYTDLDQRGPGGGGEDNFGSGIRGALFSDATPLAGDFLVNTTTQGEQSQSFVTDLPQAGFVTVWGENLTSTVFGRGTDIFGQMYSFTGVPIGAEFQVTTSMSFIFANPVAAGTADGKFIVAWEQDDDPTSGVDLNLYGQVFNGSGTSPAGSPFAINTTTSGAQHELRLEAFSDNQIIAVWTDRSNAVIADIRGRIFNSDGSAVTGEFIIARDASVSSVAPSVSILHDPVVGIGRFVVSWVTATGTVRAQVFDPVAGLTLGRDFNGSDNSENYTAQFDDTVLFGNGGNDFLTGSALADELDGGAGDDTLAGLAGNDVMRGGPGADVLNGGSGLDEAFGNEGNDQITGGDGADQLFGQGGNDTISGGNGDDTINGGGGADVLSGDANADTIFGGNGNDTLNGGGGADQLFGQADNDQLFGGNGNDTLDGGAGADSLFGQANDDILRGNNGNDILNGGGGADFLFGQANDDVAYGGDGNDVLTGGGQTDRLFGESGDDRLFGGAGNDELFGGANADLVDGNTGDDNVNGGPGNDTVLGSDGNDILRGNDGDDLLDGGNGNDQLFGQASNDDLRGNNGDDILNGGGGDDILFGQAGADTLTGGAGNDILGGGGGTDTFHFGAGWGNDTISDFANGTEFANVSTAGVSVGSLNVVTVGANAVADFGTGDTITFIGMAGNIDISDFVI